MKKRIVTIGLVMLFIICLSCFVSGCSKKENNVATDEKLEYNEEKVDSEKQAILDEIGKTEKGSRIVCYQKGEIYETYYIATFENNIMVKMTEYRLYFDREVNGKQCFDVDLEFYKQQSDFKSADQQKKVVIFENSVNTDEKQISYEDWYSEKQDAEIKFIE